MAPVTAPDDDTARQIEHRKALLRSLKRPLLLFGVVVAAGHLVSYGLAERYLRPACAQAAAERQLQSESYQLPGPGSTKGRRRSFCILRDPQGSMHRVSANRVVPFAILLDPWLTSIIVGVVGAIFRVRGLRPRPANLGEVRK